jgi:hypothetical protein
VFPVRYELNLCMLCRILYKRHCSGVVETSAFFYLKEKQPMLYSVKLRLNVNGVLEMGNYDFFYSLIEINQLFFNKFVLLETFSETSPSGRQHRSSASYCLGTIHYLDTRVDVVQNISSY